MGSDDLGFLKSVANDRIMVYWRQLHRGAGDRQLVKSPAHVTQQIVDFDDLIVIQRHVMGDRVGSWLEWDVDLSVPRKGGAWLRYVGRRARGTERGRHVRW